MPDWIAATLLVFGIVLVAVFLSLVIASWVEAGYGTQTAVACGLVFFGGVPAFFYAMLR